MARKVARTGAEFRAFKADRSVDIIRTREEWDASLASPAGPDACERGHPLRALPPEDLADFTAHLVFRDDGLAAAKVGDLADRLSYNDFRALWAMFGLDAALLDVQYLPPDTGGDGDFLKDHWCASHGTCTSASGSWCTSSC